MQILIFFLYVYLIIGGLYGVYMIHIGNSKITEFPINALGGPILMAVIIYKMLRKKKFYF